MDERLPNITVLIDPLTAAIVRAFKRRITVSEPEFCRLIGISTTTAWRLRKAGRLSHYREGGRILYGPNHVLEFLRAKEIQALRSRK